MTTQTDTTGYPSLRHVRDVREHAAALAEVVRDRRRDLTDAGVIDRLTSITIELSALSARMESQGIRDFTQMQRLVRDD